MTHAISNLRAFKDSSTGAPDFPYQNDTNSILQSKILHFYPLLHISVAGSIGESYLNRGGNMKIIMSLIAASTVWAAAFAHADSFNGEKARQVISALYNSGYRGFTDIPNKLIYRFDVECKAMWNSHLDIESELFGIPTYECYIGDATLTEAQAQVIFTAVADAVGSDSAMGTSRTRAQDLMCTIDLTLGMVDDRHICSYIP